MGGPSSYPQSTIRNPRSLVPLCVLLILYGCEGPKDLTIIGQPDGPYRLTLSLDPTPPRAGQQTHLTYRVIDTGTNQPLQNLQILHERVLHTFIVSNDFRTFAHTHHEDFLPLTENDLSTATFHYPYTFPHAGEYFVGSEFTHKGRSWIKRFTVTVSGESAPRAAPAVQSDTELHRVKSFGPYQVSLRTSPDPPVAGYDTELVCHLTRNGAQVTDLALYLGTEVHMATWRRDGEHFGHQHPYTPDMAAMMTHMRKGKETRTARDHTNNSQDMAQMMARFMQRPAKQVYHGPEVPVRHIFPAAGTYKLFFEYAPGGKILLVDFVVKVVEYTDNIDTAVESIVPVSP
jgi:hypothetical protein